MTEIKINLRELKKKEIRIIFDELYERFKDLRKSDRYAFLRISNKTRSLSV